jgi:hypothetical protein
MVYTSCLILKKIQSQHKMSLTVFVFFACWSVKLCGLERCTRVFTCLARLHTPQAWDHATPTLCLIAQWTCSQIPGQTNVVNYLQRYGSRFSLKGL